MTDTKPLTADQLTSLSRKGSYKQYYMTREHYKAGTCPFCLDNGFDPNVNLIEHQSGAWIVWQAPAALRPKAMQNGLLRHVMIAPKRHITTFAEIGQDEWADLQYMLDWVAKHYGIDSGFLFSRFGDPALTGATELHFSIQIKVPDLDMPNRKRLSEVFVKTETEDAENIARGERFSARYEEGVTPEDFDRLVAEKEITEDGRDFPKGE